MKYYHLIIFAGLLVFLSACTGRRTIDTEIIPENEATASTAPLSVDNHDSSVDEYSPPDPSSSPADSEMVSEVTEDYSNHSILSVDEAWLFLAEEWSERYPDMAANTTYDDRGYPNYVIANGVRTYYEADRPFEMVLFYDGQYDDETYKFGIWTVYYEEDGETVFSLSTNGWYRMNIYTGDINSQF